MKLLMCCIVLFVGCAAKRPTSCVSHVVEKKSVLEESKDISCSCECPTPNTNVIETGGILGGLLSLFSKD